MTDIPARTQPELLVQFYYDPALPQPQPRSGSAQVRGVPPGGSAGTIGAALYGGPFIANHIYVDGVCHFAQRGELGDVLEPAAAKLLGLPEGTVIDAAVDARERAFLVAAASNAVHRWHSRYHGAAAEFVVTVETGATSQP